MNSTDSPTTPVPVPGGYLQRLAERRAAESLARQAAYGLIVGWVLALAGGFLYFCVPSHFDALWLAAAVVGAAHLVLAFVVPQALAWPERLWMVVAGIQGHLVMLVLLTIVYFTLFWPAGVLWRRKRGTAPFYRWDVRPESVASAWVRLAVEEEVGPSKGTALAARGRSSLAILAGVLGFFARRGHYLILPILIVLLVMGLVLFFVQSSALAPFIYTLF